MARPGYLDWYDPERGEVVEIPDPDYVESPYEQAHNSGQGDAFDASTAWFYDQYPTGIPPASEVHDQDTNWYEPNTWRSTYGTPPTGPTPGVDPPPTPSSTPGEPIWENFPTTGTPTSSSSSAPRGPLFEPYRGQYQAPVFGDRFKKLMELIGPAPAFDAPAIPEIAPFTGVTKDEFYQDPSFEIRKGIGEKALLNSKAAQGLARSGGTLKDLMDYNQNFASQEYGNVHNRKYQGWQGNADVTLRRSGMEQERARSMYEPRLFEWSTKARIAPESENRAEDFARQQYLDDYGMYRDRQSDIFSRLKWLSEFGRDSAAL